MLVLWTGVAGAQVSGQYSGAEVLSPNDHLFGAYLDVSDHVVGLIAQLRLSFYPGVDFGFQGGPARIDVGGSTKGTVRLGSDLKISLRHAGADLPVDVALGGCIGVETGDNFSLFSVGPTVVASRSFRPGQPGGATPYGSLSLLFTNIDVGSLSETDLALPLRLGVEFNVNPTLRLVGEMMYRAGDDFRDKTVFSVGVNAPF
jgi:hypothetical protein